MVFETLSSELQNLVLFNHYYFLKWFVFCAIIFLASYYLFVSWKEHKKTKFILVATTRIFFFGVSVTYLLATPFLLFSLSPEVSFFSFYMLPLTLYSIIFGLSIILFFVDLFRYGFFVLLSLAGLDFGDPHVREITRGIKNNKHFLK